MNGLPQLQKWICRTIPILKWQTDFAIPRGTRPLHVCRGWIVTGEVAVGFYKVRGVKPYMGQIQVAKNPRFAICDAPKALLKGSHASCFSSSSLGSRWHGIHLHPSPTNIDQGILAVEELIRATFRAQ